MYKRGNMHSVADSYNIRAPIQQEAAWAHIRQIRYYEMLWGKSLYSTTTWDMRGIKLFLASACEGYPAWNMFSFCSSKPLLLGVNQKCTVVWGKQTVRNRQPEPKAKQLRLQVNVPVWMLAQNATCKTAVDLQHFSSTALTESPKNHTCNGATNILIQILIKEVLEKKAVACVCKYYYQSRNACLT